MPKTRKKMPVTAPRMVPTGVRCSVAGCYDQAIEEIFDDFGMPRGALCREHLRQRLLKDLAVPRCWFGSLSGNRRSGD